MTKTYVRPIPLPEAPSEAFRLAGGWVGFTEVELLSRSAPPRRVPAHGLSDEQLAPLIRPRPAIAGLSFEAPRLMGILNVTPDSFSDGGDFATTDTATAQASHLVEAGADILDIGGESTRPGAADVALAEEAQRTVPVIEALRGQGMLQPISIDTRKSAVAAAAIKAGATLINDVSAMTYDAQMGATAASLSAPICLMHTQGTPQTMQRAPSYENVLLDVYDWLEERLVTASEYDISAEQIILDPGIGFGKTTAHNLALLRGLSLFHSLGCPLLVGASRKRFIGEIGNAAEAKDRAPGSIAVALAAAQQGVQVLRVHDVQETKQALALWQAIAPEQ